MYYELMKALFNPILHLHPALFELIISVIISLFIATAYKKLTNQTLLKEYRQRSKQLSEEIKAAQARGETEKIEKLFAESMQLMNKQMLMNLKPMLLSFLIVIAFLLWISHISMPQIELEKKDSTLFGTFVENVFTDKPMKVNIKIENEKIFIDKHQNGNFEEYGIGDTIKLNNYWRINGIIKSENGYKLSLGAIMVKLPFPIPFFDYGFGWLMWYFICATFFISLFRKILGVY
jgi:uncharacterized membrane protein (DUF106 family)